MSTSSFLSATKSAHSACPCFENVQLPITVTCLLKRSLLTSKVTSPPSPTKHVVADDAVVKPKKKVIKKKKPAVEESDEE